MKLKAILFYIFLPLSSAPLLILAALGKIPFINYQNYDLLSKVAALILLILIFHLYNPSVFKKLSVKSFSIKLIPFLIICSLVTKITVVFYIIFALFQSKITFSLYPITTEVLLAFISVVLLTPLLEEFFMRGIVYNLLKKKYSIPVAVLINTLLFTLLHMSSLWNILAAFISGLILVIIYQRFGNIWYSVILHGMINAFPFLIGFLHFAK